MGMYGGILKLYKVRGTKTEHSDVATEAFPQGFRGPFLINSSWRDFENCDEGRILSSQLWVCMGEY